MLLSTYQESKQLTGPVFNVLEDRSTLIQYINAHIANGYYVYSWKFHELITYPFSNIVSQFEDGFKDMGVEYPPVEWYEGHIPFTGERGQFDVPVKNWQLDFDLMLHDAAVSYTEKAAKSIVPEYAKKHADIAIKLWMMSRQLRRDRDVKATEKYYREKLAEAKASK